MATIAERLDRVWGEKPGLGSFISTVDHKRIGIRYFITGMLFFILGGIEALIIRTQLAQARLDLVDPETFNQLFSMHGITMMFLFAMPVLSGFGNYFVPLMIGARDMAFPRLNAFGYWVFLAGGIFMYSAFLTGSAPNDGWFNYLPLGDKTFTPGPNIDFYALGLIFLGISTTGGAINFIVTILKLRAPGMTLNRIPIFVWGELAMAFQIVFALPMLTLACVLLILQRKFGFHFYDSAAGGDPILWQHLFWIFGHPEVYIVVLPAFGIASAIIPTHARRPMVGYTYIVLAELATALIGFGVWVHHMFATGLPQMTMAFISAASFMVAIPSGVQVFGWLATLVTGKLVLKTPMLYILGFIATFVIGGVTGVMFSAIPFDQATTDSYFVVAHLHYVLVGGAVFPMLAAIFHWGPKMTGRMLDERSGKRSLLVRIHRVQPEHVPPPHLRAAGATPAYLHVRREPRLGHPQLAIDHRRVPSRNRGPFDRHQLVQKQASWCSRRRRSVERRNTRVGDDIAATALQLRDRTDGAEQRADVGSARAAGRAASRAGGVRAR